jgi:hypothetical protein
VEGAHLRASRNDSGNDPIQILQHISRCDAHYGESFSLQMSITSSVPARLIAIAVPFAVDLDD